MFDPDQVKSAIGNNGEFEPGAGLTEGVEKIGGATVENPIVAGWQRRPMPEVTESIREWPHELNGMYEVASYLSQWTENEGEVDPWQIESLLGADCRLILERMPLNQIKPRTP